jgi:hypothetical protein
VACFAERNAWLARKALFEGDTARALAKLKTRTWGAELSVPWRCADRFLGSDAWSPKVLPDRGGLRAADSGSGESWFEPREGQLEGPMLLW